MLTYKLMKLRIFLGAVITGADTALCVAVVKGESSYQRLPEMTINAPDLTEHRAVILAVDKLLRDTIPAGVDVNVYTNCEEVAFEWREEYKKDRTFCKSTADQDAWKRLIDYIEGKNIKLDIKGSESALTAFTQLERERVDTYGGS